MVETGVNLRQAVSPILAATAEVISGPSTGQITIKAGNNSSTKIVATRDKIGNRTTVVFDSACVIKRVTAGAAWIFGSAR